MNKFHSSLINRNKEIWQNIIFIYFIIGSSNGRIIYIVYTSQSGPSIEKVYEYILSRGAKTLTTRCTALFL